MIDYNMVYNDFFSCIERIKRPDIKAFVYDCLQKVKVEFFGLEPASSSGKWHPPENNILFGGTLVHTVKAVEVAVSLFRFYDVYDDTDRDIITSAVILHDSFKGGIAWTHTVENHAYLARTAFEEVHMDDEYVKEKILLCIETHMSRWGRPFSTLLRGYTPDKLQRIVALADFIASRSNISFYPGISVLEED